MADTPRFRSFTDLSRLDPGALRTLLRAGDPTERVWAAWALGLALGDEVKSDLRARVIGDPIPGVRANLVVILAGHGEAEGVRALALSDPDAEVRAVACTYLSRISGGAAEVATLLEGRFDDDSAWPVQIALLRLAMDGKIAPTGAQAATAAARRDITVRRLGLEYALGSHAAFVVDRTWLEEDGELREAAIAGVLREVGAVELLARLSQAAVDPGSTLDALAAHGARAPWSSLEFIAERRTPDDDLRAVRLLDPADLLTAVPWLVGVAGREARAVRGWSPQPEAADLLGGAHQGNLERILRGVETAQLTKALAFVTGSVEEARQYAEYDDEVDELEASEWFARHQALARTLARAIKS